MHAGILQSVGALCMRATRPARHVAMRCAILGITAVCVLVFLDAPVLDVHEDHLPYENGVVHAEYPTPRRRSTLGGGISDRHMGKWTDGVMTVYVLMYTYFLRNLCGHFENHLNHIVSLGTMINTQDSVWIVMPRAYTIKWYTTMDG